mgnify:CR=1 FL=1
MTNPLKTKSKLGEGRMKDIKFKSMLKDLKEACYVGEDGNMATICKTKRGAWIKFRQQVGEDCGEYEASEIKMEDIDESVAHLAAPEEIEENDEYAWYVGKNIKSQPSVKCWYYCVN